MEQQQSTDPSTSRRTRHEDEQSAPLQQEDLTSSASVSSISLRFPTPQGSQHLAKWVSDSSRDIKSPPAMSDENNLADSAYELINSTDGESQDSQISESVSSLDYPRADDVHSINGDSESYRTESDADSDEEEADDQAGNRHSPASSIRYADQGLRNPSTKLPSSSLEFQPTPEATSMLPQSIEFHEADPEDKDGHIHVEKISVKHTIREFDEDETAKIAKNLGLTEAPNRLVATIRQTMSQACLSTQEPLRILYTGSHGALRDIVYKLSTAIYTSGSTGQKGKASQRSSDAVYNIVPISSFGSGKTPEIELMESSGYQIAVDHCTRAEEMIIDGGSFPGDTVYSITIGQVGQSSPEKTYKSLFSPSGSIIQPKWTLPHVAIFYCTENEDEVAERTRDIAWEFMSRHGVPSIFICNEETFTKPPSGRWRDFVDQHAVHLCLESRDPDRPILSQRLPIDIVTFLNIDARQMNRNLAYLTGLTEPDDESSVEAESFSEKVPDKKPEETNEKEQEEKTLLSSIDDLKEWSSQFFAQHRQHMWSVAMTLLGGVFAMAVAAWLPSSGLLSTQRSATTAALSSVSSAVSTAAVSTSTTTVIINVTSTKTVNLQRAEASASPLASALSFAGLLSDKVSTSTIAEPEPTKSVCSIERYGDNEILIRIPTSKKSGWLAKGAIDIDVFRGEQPIKTKLSSVDEGIVVGLDKKDAYGVLNISVVVTRKPKINETFEVNLGNSVVVEALEAAANIVQGLCEKAVNSGETVLNSGVDAVKTAADSLVKAAHSVEDGVRAIDNTILAAAGKVAGAGQVAGQAAQGYAQHAFDEALQSPKHVAKAVEGARQHIADRVAVAKAGAKLNLLKAQIASKLWSLKIRGKTDEHARYQKKATEFLKKKHEELARSLKSSEGATQQKDDCGCFGSKMKTRKCIKKCSSSWKKASKAGGRWKMGYGG